MIRLLKAVALFVSFIAMSSSGMMMLFIEKPSFTIQMPAAHKLFGLVMMVALICHLSLNIRMLASNVKARSVAMFAGLFGGN